MKNTLVELKEKRDKLNRQISDIEYSQMVEVSIPKLKKSVGKCFKYLNSYGGDRPKWFFYTKIIGIDEKTMTFKTVEFQRTSMDIIEIKFDQKYNFNGENYFNNSGYIEIKKSEYERARKAMSKMVDRLLNQH